MKEEKKYTIGIDIGGSHISSAAVDIDDFEFLPGSSYSAEINNRLDKEHILGKWAEVINKSLTHLKDKTCVGIGFAMPGPFDYPKGVAKFKGNDKYENLYDVPVRSELNELIDQPALDLCFFNDASSFGVGAQISLGSKARRAVGLTLGTGFGSVFLQDGAPLLEGPDIPPNGSLWSLNFKDSIADDYFGTRWFTRTFEARTGIKVTGVKEIIATKHPEVASIFDEFAANLGSFVLPYLVDFKAEELLLGGNIARSHPYFLPQLDALFEKNGIQMKIHILEDTEQCNILGASQLMLSDYWGERKDLNTLF